MSYTVGDVVVTAITFRNRKTGALVNPSAWQIEVKPPNAEMKVLVFDTDDELDQLEDPPGTPLVGRYVYRQPTNADDNTDAGRWQGFVSSTGTGQASQPFHFVVGARPDLS